MIKLIKKHTHVFLIFLGGLFLMSIGSALIPLSSAADISNAISVEQVVESQGNYYILAPKADVKYKRTMKFEAGINSIKVYRDNEQIGVIKVDRDATSANLTIGKDGLLPLSQNTDLFNMKGLDQYNREIFNKQIVVMNNQETFYAFIKQINAQIQVQKSNVGLTNACETDADCGENGWCIKNQYGNYCAGSNADSALKSTHYAADGIGLGLGYNFITSAQAYKNANIDQNAQVPKDIIGIADYFMKQFNALWNAIFLNIENVRTMIEELRFNFGYKQASENIEFETLKRENAALVEFLIKIAPNMRDEIESEMKNLEYMKTIEDINLGVNYSYEYAQLLDERGFKSEALEYVNQMKLKMIEYAAMKENEKYLFSSDIRNEYLKAADNFNIIAEQIKQ